MVALTDGFIFVMGLILGSFLNVCIWRMPKGESVVMPGSHCPRCNKSIAWYDNVPLISYAVLLGKCRRCGQKISPRYFFVELLSGLFWLYLWYRYGLSPFFIAGGILFSILLAVTATDFETGYIPDQFTIPGMVLGLFLSSVMPLIQNEVLWYRGLLQSGLGLLAGGGILWITGFLGNLIFKKESMGGGDIKLLALIGSFLGFNEVVMVFFLAPIFAVPFALYVKITKRAETIPFGPFLAMAAGLSFIFGDKILSWFFSTYGA